MLEAGIEDLQKTMNGIGEYVQGKHMILQSFLASQTSRAKLQDNRMADLKHDISLAEATSRNLFISFAHYLFINSILICI